MEVHRTKEIWEMTNHCYDIFEKESDADTFVNDTKWVKIEDIIQWFETQINTQQDPIVKVNLIFFKQVIEYDLTYKKKPTTVKRCEEHKLYLQRDGSVYMCKLGCKYEVDEINDLEDA